MFSDELIPQALLAQSKNINDLIGQELSVWVLAILVSQQPELEKNVEAIFQKIYQNTAQNLENLILDFISNQPEQFAQVDLDLIKQKIQLLVNQLVKEKKQEFNENLRWLTKS
jgi:GTPase SAR1 family protein